VLLANTMLPPFRQELASLSFCSRADRWPRVYWLPEGLGVLRLEFPEGSPSAMVGGMCSRALNRGLNLRKVKWKHDRAAPLLDHLCAVIDIIGSMAELGWAGLAPSLRYEGQLENQPPWEMAGYDTGTRSWEASRDKGVT